MCTTDLQLYILSSPSSQSNASSPIFDGNSSISLPETETKDTIQLRTVDPPPPQKGEIHPLHINRRIVTIWLRQAHWEPDQAPGWTCLCLLTKNFNGLKFFVCITCSISFCSQALRIFSRLSLWSELTQCRFIAKNTPSARNPALRRTRSTEFRGRG